VRPNRNGGASNFPSARPLRIAGRRFPGRRAARPRFLCDSLSDLLTRGTTIRARLEAAAAADFVIALYNPRSERRPARLAEAADILLRHRPAQTPVFIGRNLGRDREERRIIALSELAGADIDMLTLVIVGSRRTRRIDGNPPYLYTPRGYFDGASE
jgi:cobalt-precorrin 5A hydrolase/precorrin-3B C17-methyltransferase